MSAEEEHQHTGTSATIDESHSIKNEKTSSGDDEPEFKEKPATAYLFICILCGLVAFGGYVFGFDTGTISGFVNMPDFLQRFGQKHANGEYYLSNVRTGLIVSIFNIGCAVGGLVLCKVGDVWGRRMGIIVAMLFYIVGIIIQIASEDKWYQYFIGRLITGLGVGTTSVLSPLFISESAPKHLRGTLVCCYQLMVTLGIFLGYCTTYGTKNYTDSRQWRIPLGLCFAWALFLISAMVFMPESPRYLIEHQKFDEAKASVAKSNQCSPEDPAVYTEVELIQAGIDREALAGSAGWMELITGKPKMLERVILGMVLQSIQQLTGNNYFFYYGTTIFKAVGMSDSFQTSIVLGIVNFASTGLGIFAIERMGRRSCLLVGSACMSVCFLIYSILGSVNLYIDGYENTPSNTRKPTGNAMIFITCFFIFFFASTWAGGVYSIVSETYPLRIRSKGMSVATAANWMWGFLISFFTPFITGAIHFYYGFVFTGCLIFSFFYVFFFVRETKGLSLEEVDELYATDIRPWKTAGWVPPTADDMAHTTGFAEAAKPTNAHV
ncbi:hypothetical protein JCM33374_g6597 [Metschnikowia sp. JCM 33374]|nr:hypothetical protein JCM33374_g6597 [Metschnikowia sp. JCM 33374]